MWSLDGQVLIHEATIDSIHKTSLVKTFKTFSELNSKTPLGKILRAIDKLVRTETPDGAVTVHTTHDERQFEPLP